MKSEEISAMGLRGPNIIADVTIRCAVSSFDDDYIRAQVGDGLIHRSVIVAIERVMPDLEEGWTWGLASDCHGAAALAHGPRGAIATIDKMGGMQCFEYLGGSPSGHAKTPARIAKALIEVWEARQ